MHRPHGAIPRLTALRPYAARDDHLFTAALPILAAQTLDERQRRRSDEREGNAVQVITAVRPQLHELAPRRRPLHGVAGLVKRETIIHGVIIHALDTLHRAAQ